MLIRARPTVYAGIHFRSRLEATWAAMFDQLGWSWEYEPFQIGRWLPDFAVKASAAPKGAILCEVKPTFDFPEEAAKKAWDSCDGHDCLLLGAGLIDSEWFYDSTKSIGWLSDRDGGCWAGYEPEDNAPLWEPPCMETRGGIGMCHPTGRWFNRMSGEPYKPATPERLKNEALMAMWGAAKKATRYEPLS